jgi:hypothetical protein
MHRVPATLAVALSALLSAATVLGAQVSPTGSIRGIVVDEQGAAVPGVTVTAASPTVPGIFAATTDAAGEYRLADLPPGDYTVIGELTGFARVVRTPVAVRTGLNLVVSLTMTVGAIDETVQVRGETPLLETSTATRSVNISGELLRATPLSERREWYSALALAPGVTTAEWVNNDKLFYVHGADPSANVIQIDGADVTTAARSGVSYVSLNTDAIDDIQIKTAGVDASAPLGLGGIINIATASGTNTIKGAFTVFGQPLAWNDSNTPGGTSSTVEQLQIDASGGAPVKKDRLWAFGAYRFSDIRTGVSRTAAELDALRALVPGYAPFDNENRAHFWFAKLTAKVSAGHQLFGFYQEDTNPVLVATPTAAHPFEEATGGSSASVRATSVWTSRITTRVAASYNDKRRRVDDTGIAGPLHRIYRGTLLSSGRLTGNGALVIAGNPVQSELTQPNRKIVVSADATIAMPSSFGSHDLQAGVYLVPAIHNGNHNRYINDGFNLEESVLRDPASLAGGIVPFHRTIMNGRELTSFRQRGRDAAVYIQDAWRPLTRLTLNAGIRIDRIVVRDLVFGVETQRSVDVGPRLGVNYAVTADGRQVVRGHWVRVHDQPGIVTTVGSLSVGQQDLYDLDLNGTFETVFVTPPTFGVTANRVIDPDLHQPFADEAGAGYAVQLPGGIGAGADVVQRRYRDRPTSVETNGVYDGSVFAGYADEAFNEIFKGTNNRWNSPVYRSLELTLTKRSARVQALASLVRQWRHMDGTWQPHDPASFIQPSAFANDRGIGSTTGTTSAATDANSLSGTHMTQRSTASAQWQDYAWRSGLVVNAPWGVSLATNYTFQSGIWSGPIVTRLSAADPAFGPATVRLSNGRVVSNPLATLIRFANPTRGDRQLRTPRFHAWNVRVGRRFGFRAAKVDASLDFFNLTNNDADLGFQSGANQTYNSLYGTTTFRQLPRSAQVTVRTTF